MEVEAACEGTGERKMANHLASIFICDLRAALRDLELCSAALVCRSVRGWRLHHGGLLVHLVNVFANPAVTLARAASDMFGGIRPGDVPGFIAAQLAGAAAATILFRWLVPSLPDRAASVVVSHFERQTP
jgi:hypothetical protein